PASPSFSSADEIPQRRENASEADFPIPRGSLPGKASARPVAMSAAVAPAGVNASTGAPSSPPAFAAAGSSQVPVSAAHPGGRTGLRRNHPLDAESASPPEGSAGQQPAPFQRPSALPLSHAVTDEQVQQIAPDVPPQTIVKIREQFEQEAGIADLAPADPEYQRRWQIAEPTAADRMRTLYGWAAYGEFVRQAALAAQH
ncbi:MAG: hypothetical protein JWO82_3727, partial [Akkermansiaceae bacterium]|nr:hypothetical protein [Akkermansiaceae bacterium]